MMRKIIGSLALLLLSRPTWAHGPEELGHHWAVPEYSTEMLTQVFILAAIAGVVCVGLLIKDMLRRRSAR